MQTHSRSARQKASKPWRSVLLSLSLQRISRCTLPLAWGCGCGGPQILDGGPRPRARSACCSEALPEARSSRLLPTDTTRPPDASPPRSRPSPERCFCSCGLPWPLAGKLCPEARTRNGGSRRMRTCSQPRRVYSEGTSPPQSCSPERHLAVSTFDSGSIRGRFYYLLLSFRATIHGFPEHMRFCTIRLCCIARLLESTKRTVFRCAPRCRQS